MSAKVSLGGTPLSYLSVCSGIEAATCAWHPLGWQPFAFSEIEPFPSAVLAHHYQAVPNLGDMTKYKEWPDATIDLLVGGTPCQSFSVAGLRKGLADPRGNLMLTYLAIADRYRPTWLVWENVPGVLSSNGGRDFGALLGGLEKLGYGFAYRVLDAQYFGVPQRRRRVFVVGHLGDWRRAAAVLFERHSLQGHPAPSREKGEGVAVCPTLRAGGNRTGGDRPPGTDVDTCESLIAFDTTQITSVANFSNPQPGDPCHPLARGAHAPAIAFGCKASGQNGFGVGEIASTMRSMGRSGSHQNGGGHQAVAVAVGWSEELTAHLDCAGTIQRGGDGGRHDGVMTTSMQVRRLTPRECERLQGFPDDYTLIQVRGKPAADGPRYKALGNSMAVPVMAWIGKRIQMVEAIQRKEAA